jgi:uncharacterized lipoprotein YmbA
MAVALVAVGVAGCSFVSPPPKSYLLSAAAPAVSSDALGGPVVGVGPVTIPTYLDRPSIVLRAAGDEVAISA